MTGVDHTITFFPIFFAHRNNIVAPIIITNKGTVAATGSLGKIWLATNIAIGGLRNPVPTANTKRALLFLPPVMYPMVAAPTKLLN